jgi:hypothetical protein
VYLEGDGAIGTAIAARQLQRPLLLIEKKAIAFRPAD